MCREMWFSAVQSEKYSTQKKGKPVFEEIIRLEFPSQMALW